MSLATASPARAATLSVSLDTNAPVVLSASSLLPNSLNVIFSEPVDPVTAQDCDNYTLAATRSRPSTLVGSTNVQITVDNPITANYTLSVSKCPRYRRQHDGGNQCRRHRPRLPGLAGHWHH